MSRNPCAYVGCLHFFNWCIASSRIKPSPNSKSATNAATNLVRSNGTSKRPPCAFGRTVYFLSLEKEAQHVHVACMPHYRQLQYLKQVY